MGTHGRRSGGAGEEPRARLRLKVPSTALKGLKFRRMLLEVYRAMLEHRMKMPPKAFVWLERRLIDPPRYQGTLTDRELGSWRVSAKLQLELADQTREEMDWRGAFWGLAGALQASKFMTESAIRHHTSAKPQGEHLKMKASDLLRLLDAVEGR